MSRSTQTRNPQKPSVRNLLRKVHESEEGSVSLETVLIIGAISIPILIFMLKVGWPKIKSYFMLGLSDMEAASDRALGP